jgi:hypothetical protein
MKLFRFGERSLVALSGKYCLPMIPLLLVSFNLFVFAAEVPDLQVEDCAKCHSFQLRMIAKGGGKHATEVSCLDCHPQHPPKGGETIVACAICHQGEPHLEIGDCLHCHANPHRPLESLQDPLKPARKECLSCHAEVGERMVEAPSRHAELFCTRCHDRHGFIPSCVDCHKPHMQDQSAAACLQCHSAHRPLQIVPSGYVPAAFCRVCHKEKANDLAETNTNHGGINCVYCHKGLHLSLPSCQDCHGLPHAKAIHSQYRKCLDCHEDAHRLVSKR